MAAYKTIHIYCSDNKMKHRLDVLAKAHHTNSRSAEMKKLIDDAYNDLMNIKEESRTKKDLV